MKVLAIGVLLGAICSAQSPGLKTLSTPPEMVGGGDVLVEAAIPTQLAGKHATFFLNGLDITGTFRPAENGALRGLVTGLNPSENVIEMKIGGKSAKLNVKNHLITGPVFSGPHQEPFVCQTEINKLGPPLDKDCSAKTDVSYLYYSSAPLPPNTLPVALPGKLPPGFKPFDPAAARPNDIAKTMTTQGHMVDYIVRVEKGTINRAVYEIAFLHEPGRPMPTPWESSAGWNGRIVYSFGGDCKAGYRQGVLPSTLNDMRISQGYAVAASSLNIFGNDCDDVISAETLMMVKEHFIKSFGVPVHTIGEGGSGGAMQQYLIAQNYPGLLDGIMPLASYPDVTSVAGPVSDCALLGQAFMQSKLNWSDEQRKAVSGYYSWASCGRWMGTGYAFDPSQKIKPDGHGFVQAAPCDAVVPKEKVYDPVNNPHGVRCSVYDNEVNVYGRDERGAARRPLDNIGVQYGLLAFNAGTISADQFLDLNEKVGGYDNDGKLVPARTVANLEALKIAYSTGRVNMGGGGLSEVPIIDMRPYMDSFPDIHDQVRSFAERERLKAANGNADNQVIITLPGPSGPVATALLKLFDPKSIVSIQMKDELRLMDLWLDRIAADTKPGNASSKVARNKPAELVDGCFTEGGEKIAETRAYGNNGRCNQLFPVYGDPRIASGGPLAGNILKCQLKPIDAKDYKQTLTGSQMTKLEEIFPQGVCDYSKPGVEQKIARKTWQSF
jgi:Tannase-like family of unknown function (DUF6351)